MANWSECQVRPSFTGSKARPVLELRSSKHLPPYAASASEMLRNALSKQRRALALDLTAAYGRRIPKRAGVGYFFDLAAITHGETVVDLGSGSGSDAFIAAGRVGRSGRVIGVDMTDAQLEKARTLAGAHAYGQAEFRKGLIEELPLRDDEADCMISNGVINLAADKAAVFAEAARILRSGGRFAFADIVTETQLPANITCNTTLWAACIGGAAEQNQYRAQIEAAGFRVLTARENTAYAFLSKSAQGATREFGVKSMSFLAVKEA